MTNISIFEAKKSKKRTLTQRSGWFCLLIVRARYKANHSPPDQPAGFFFVDLNRSLGSEIPNQNNFFIYKKEVKC